MTRNQIEYAKHLENRRSNQAQEALTRSRDQRDYEVRVRSAAEAERANRAKEAQAVKSLDETVRSNVAKEGLTARDISEKERGNKATEAIRIGEAATKALGQAEQVRANLAREAETALHNRAMEVKPMQPITTITQYTTPQQPAAPAQIVVDLGSQPIASSRGLPGNTVSTPRLQDSPDSSSSRATREPKITGPSQLKVLDVQWSPVTGLSGDTSSISKRQINSMKESARNGEKSKRV